MDIVRSNGDKFSSCISATNFNLYSVLLICNIYSTHPHKHCALRFYFCLNKGCHDAEDDDDER